MSDTTKEKNTTTEPSRLERLMSNPRFCAAVIVVFLIAMAILRGDTQ